MHVQPHVSGKSEMMLKSVVVVGGGVAGLSAALELACSDLNVTVVERSFFAGGHALRFACKATDACVKCGACLAEEKLGAAMAHPKIQILNAATIHAIRGTSRRTIQGVCRPTGIDPRKCTNCGACLAACPVHGAVIKGSSAHQVSANTPLYAIDADKCANYQGVACHQCQEACPEGAIDLDQKASEFQLVGDAIIWTTGFLPYNPRPKPYGYGRFANVITNLELEEMLREEHQVRRPSDGTSPERIAFIQCVGSRDAKLNHLWCSQVCCGAALRMADLILAQSPEAEISVFYIDIQNFGRDFNTRYPILKSRMVFKRALAGDVYEETDHRLRLCYFDNTADEAAEELFDLVVLSVGLTPVDDNQALMQLLGLAGSNNGFAGAVGAEGVFCAGTARGPMSIADTVADAGRAAHECLSWLAG